MNVRADLVQKQWSAHNENGDFGKISSRAHRSAFAFSSFSRNSAWKFVRRGMICYLACCKRYQYRTTAVPNKCGHRQSRVYVVLSVSLKGLWRRKRKSIGGGLPSASAALENLGRVGKACSSFLTLDRDVSFQSAPTMLSCNG